MRVAMISDFFFPNVGGVENHIYALSHCLAAEGHKVTVITRNRKEHGITGVRYCRNSVKVYYLPAPNLAVGIVKPMIFSTFSLLIRNILLRERVQIAHGHQRTSLLTIISIFVCQTIGLPFVVTQHSLMGFNDLSAVELNGLYTFLRPMIAHHISVSNAVRENEILARVCSPQTSTVIPNAIDSRLFSQLPAKSSDARVRIIVLTRLTFRKGIDLLLELIPGICSRFSNVQFVISGEGPARALLERLVEMYGLGAQVHVCDFIRSSEVPGFLATGDIFLNTSISDAFCMAVLEAAACGLYVLTTDVGGIPEILPPGYITLSAPTAEALMLSLAGIIENKTYVKGARPLEWIRETYSWEYVARETARVYRSVVEGADCCSLYTLLIHTFKESAFAFVAVVLLMVILRIYILIATHVYPRCRIQYAVDLPLDL